MELSANQVGVWILVLVALIPAAKVVVDWIKPTTHRIEQPVETREVDTFAPLKHVHTELQTENRCEAIHRAINGRLDSFSSEIRTALQEHDRKAESRTSDVHERLNNLVTCISDNERRVTGDIAEVRGSLTAHIQSHSRAT
jgi:hypothetical protein